MFDQHIIECMHSIKVKTMYKFLQALEKKGDEMLSSMLDDVLSLPQDDLRKSDYILLIISQNYNIKQDFYLNTKNVTAVESEAKKIAVYLILTFTDLSPLSVADMFNYKNRESVYQIKWFIEGLDKRIPSDRELLQNIEFLSNRIKEKYGQEK